MLHGGQHAKAVQAEDTLRLRPTGTAHTLYNHQSEAKVIDGPFAESPSLVGFIQSDRGPGAEEAMRTLVVGLRQQRYEDRG